MSRLRYVERSEKTSEPSGITCLPQFTRCLLSWQLSTWLYEELPEQIIHYSNQAIAPSRPPLFPRSLCTKYFEPTSRHADA